MKVGEKSFLEESQNSKTIKEHLSKYTSKWYLFLVSLGLCVTIAFLYVRYQVPKYVVSTSFLVKNSGSSSSSNDLIDEALKGKEAVNLNNVMLVISSSALMERVVRKQNFNITYYKSGKVLDIDVYQDAPFVLAVTDSLESNPPVTLKLTSFNANGGSGRVGVEKNGKKFDFRWSVPFAVEGKTFVLKPKSNIINGNTNYIVIWKPVGMAAGELSSAISIAPFDIKTSAIELSMKVENLERGKDILNTVYKEFNLADVEDRTKVSENTVHFINERLALISSELNGVEGTLESYQGKKQIFDIKAQSATSLVNSNDALKTIKDLAVQQGVTSMIQNYFQNPANSNKLVPSSLGLNDATLASLINQYNDIQLKKERETPFLAPNSPVLTDYNTQTNNLKSSILESLNNISRNLDLQQRSFEQRNNGFNQFLSSVPRSERTLLEIKRKQSITEGIYLYLLQKREEEAISSTSATISNYRQIDLAKGYGPVEPNKRNAFAFASLLGLLLPFGFIYLKDLFNDKVTNKEDVTRKLDLQVFGEIGHVSKKKRSLLSVLSQDVISEQFRVIRTNLASELKNKRTKTILITSSSANEGKSFVSLNLAAVCAASGKKVALLEFDIRNPHLSDALKIKNEKGITSYLMGEIDDISELAHVVDEVPSLHIYTAGPIPEHPADLLLSENVAQFFEYLKYKYDYILVDSPPAGLVSDAFILDEYCDRVLYIIRQRKTFKKQLSFINDVHKSDRLKNIGLVLNDMKTGAEYGYYNYGYGKYNYGAPKSKVSNSFFK